MAARQSPVWAASVKVAALVAPVARGRVLGMLTLPTLVRVSADAEAAKTATSERMVSRSSDSASLRGKRGTHL